MRRLNHVLLGMPERYIFGDIRQFDHSYLDNFTNAYNEYIQGILKSEFDIRNSEEIISGISRIKLYKTFFVFTKKYQEDDYKWNFLNS